MVIVKRDIEEKLKTPSQEKLIFQLLQSKAIKKLEFEGFYKKTLKQIITCYDASCMINYLLATIKYRKRFLSSKCKARAKCVYCGKTEELQRYFSLPMRQQMFMCFNCEDKFQDNRQELAIENVENGNRETLEK
ncbi:MAG TPA: hypothetical protein VMV32_12315 [Ignavibacteriaceae bacterium]|nr:hypothetical protein [Ignavibacteriaceae bacterium]